MTLSPKQLLLAVLGLAPLAAVPAWSEDGGALYQEHCAVCHGDQGDGMTRARHGLNPPPRDFTTVVASAELDRDRMIHSVTEGRDGTAMMAFGGRLSDDQIIAVVDYVRNRFMQSDHQPVDPAMVMLDHGKRIYTANCAVCHGDGGNGAMWTQTSLNPPPRDFTAADPGQLSRERMVTSVRHGRSGTAMMSFSGRLSDQDIDAVVDYVRTAFMIRTAPAAQLPAGHPPAQVAAEPLELADMSLPFPNELRGDAARGREFYLANCFTCHGVAGDGAGPRAHFIQPPPRNFLSEQARKTLNRPALLTAIGVGKPGTVMPAWSKVLTDQQIADVAEFVFQAFIEGDGAGAPAADGAQKKKAGS